MLLSFHLRHYLFVYIFLPSCCCCMCCCCFVSSAYFYRWSTSERDQRHVFPDHIPDGKINNGIRRASLFWSVRRESGTPIPTKTACKQNEIAFSTLIQGLIWSSLACFVNSSRRNVFNVVEFNALRLIRSRYLEKFETYRCLILMIELFVWRPWACCCNVSRRHSV